MSEEDFVGVDMSEEEIVKKAEEEEMKLFKEASETNECKYFSGKDKELFVYGYITGVHNRLFEISKSKDLISMLLDCLRLSNNTDSETVYFIKQCMDEAEKFLKESK